MQSSGNTSTYWYVLVRTGTYWYVLVQVSSTHTLHFDDAPAPFQRLRVSAERLACSTRTTLFFRDPGWACNAQTSRAKYLKHIAATPAISIYCVCSAHGEAQFLVLAELVWDCTSRCRVTTRNKGMRGTLPSTLAST